MIEKNRIYIKKWQLEKLIREEYNILEHTIDNHVIDPTFEYTCETEPESGEIVKITEKFILKDFENVREISITDDDITSIMEDFLSDTDYSFSAFACHFDSSDTKVFDGIYVYITKKQTKKLEKRI